MVRNDVFGGQMRSFSGGVSVCWNSRVIAAGQGAADRGVDTKLCSAAGDEESFNTVGPEGLFQIRREKGIAGGLSNVKIFLLDVEVWK